jgi:hypothetical protein
MTMFDAKQWMRLWDSWQAERRDGARSHDPFRDLDASDWRIEGQELLRSLVQALAAVQFGPLEGAHRVAVEQLICAARHAVGQQTPAPAECQHEWHMVEQVGGPDRLHVCERCGRQQRA